MRIRLLNQYFTSKELWKLRKGISPLIFSPAKIWNVLKLHRDLSLKRTWISGKPYILMVEPTSFCDMTCPMCPVILNKTTRNKASLSFDVFNKLIEEIGSYLCLITFWNFGEPLLNRDIFRMIKLAKTRKIFCAVSSNLLSLTPERAAMMIDSGLDYLIVSFDGASEETYESFRGKGNFRRVVENLQNLLKIREDKKAINPFVNLQYIVMRENEHEIDDIRRFARSIEVDKLSLKKFTYVSEMTEKFLPRNPEYILNKYKTVASMISCARPWNSAVLTAAGAIVPCCGDLNFEYKFGDLSNSSTSFMGIWNGDLYRDFRGKILQDINSIAMCRTCPSTNFTTDMFIE